MKTESHEQQQLVPCEGAKSRNWYAWLDAMPPKPDHLHVTGEVLVGNPGVYALLLKKEPQSLNPAILLLDLFLIQKPGLWPQRVTWVPARFDEVIVEENLVKEVHVLCGSEVIAKIPVKEVG